MMYLEIENVEIEVEYGHTTTKDATFDLVTEVVNVLPDGLLHPSLAMMFTW